MEEQATRPDPQAIETTLLRLVGEREGKTVDPQEAARELGGAIRINGDR